jgi:NitT/TauT family transport system substrate-binding protein
MVRNSKKIIMRAMQQRIIKSILHPLVFIILAFIMVTCRQSQSAQQPVKIGTNDWIGYSPFILAEKAGLFSKNEANVELVNFASAQQEIEALREGKINGAALTFDEVVTLVDAGFPLKVVLVLDFSTGGDVILGQMGITTMGQLEGKKVGYEGSVVGEFLLSNALSKNGLRKTAIELVDVPAEEWAASFQSQKVDALVCYNPVASQLINKVQANVLFNSAEIPFQIIDVLVFSESCYNDNKDVLVKITQSWFDALEFQNENREQAMNIITQVKKIDSVDYQLSLNGLLAPDIELNQSLFNPETDQNIYKYAQPIINFMLSKGMLSKRISTSDLFPGDVLDATGSGKNN